MERFLPFLGIGTEIVTMTISVAISSKNCSPCEKVQANCSSLRREKYIYHQIKSFVLLLMLECRTKRENILLGS